MASSPKLDRTVPVLLLRTDPCAIHHGSVAVARRLGRLGVPVYAMVEDRYTPLAMSRYVAGAVVSKATDPEGLLDCVQTIGDRMRGPAVLLPTDDRGAVIVAEHADTLGNRFLFPRVAADLPRRLANKTSLYALCRETGIACPEYAVASTLDQVVAFMARARFPVVVKAGQHARRLGDRHSSCLVETPQELLSLIGAEGFESGDIVLQEFIPGEDWIFHGYCNPQTGCLVGFTGRKLRSYPAFAGPTTLGVSVRNATLHEQAAAMLKATGFCGIVDLDVRHDTRDGRYKLLDFNPRVGANYRMFEDRAGMDVARALHLDLTGQAVEVAPMVEGRRFIVELHDIAAAMAYRRRGELTIPGWLRSLAGPRELAWWSWRDPLPFLAMTARLLLRACDRGSRAATKRVASWLAMRRREALRQNARSSRPYPKEAEHATMVAEESPAAIRPRQLR